MEKTIVVESILRKETSEGKQYFVLRSDGEGYFWWKEALLDGVEEGCQVKIGFIQGKYPKIRAMELVGGSAQAGQPAEANSRDQLIIRSVALKAAVSTSVIEGKKPVEVIEIAEDYRRWFQGSGLELGLWLAVAYCGEDRENNYWP